MAKKSRIPIFPLLGIILCLLLAYPAGLRSSPENPEKGKAIFETQCAACHTIGGGARVGPDLKDITGLRSTAWLTNFISDPHKMIQSDPDARALLKKFGLEMPGLGLSPAQVGDVIAYLKSASSPKAQAPPMKVPAPGPSAQAPLAPQAPAPSAPPLAPPASGAPVAAMPVGSANMGRQLFSGLVPFQKGGPSCISCHDVASLPFPGGGTLGPDLTGVYGKLGAAGLASALTTLPFPTMAPLFTRRPLTTQEQQNVEAFLQKAGVESLISRGVQIGLAGLGGLLILIIAIWIIWQNRLVTVRRALVAKGERIGGADR